MFNDLKKKISRIGIYLALLCFTFFCYYLFIFQGRKINREEKKSFSPIFQFKLSSYLCCFLVDKQRFGILLLWLLLLFLLLYPHKQINMGLINETKKSKIWQISGLSNLYISTSLAWYLLLFENLKIKI